MIDEINGEAMLGLTGKGRGRGRRVRCRGRGNTWRSWPTCFQSFTGRGRGRQCFVTFDVWMVCNMLWFVSYPKILYLQFKQFGL